MTAVFLFIVHYFPQGTLSGFSLETGKLGFHILVIDTENIFLKYALKFASLHIIFSDAKIVINYILDEFTAINYFFERSDYILLQFGRSCDCVHFIPK